MPISIVCPSCNAKMNVPDKAAGRKAKCPDCANIIEIPSDTSVEAALCSTETQQVTEKAAELERPEAAGRYSIGELVGGGGLSLLFLSPFLPWVSTTLGGRIGLSLSFDGIIFFTITVLAIVGYVAGITRIRLQTPAFWLAQIWGGLAAFWMASMIYMVGNATGTPDGPMLPATPGFGLFLGLIGGLATAIGLGFTKR